jgi:hypothetical protein
LQILPFSSTALLIFGKDLLEVTTKILQGDDAIVDFDKNINGGSRFLRAGGD